MVRPGDTLNALFLPTRDLSKIIACLQLFTCHRQIKLCHFDAYNRFLGFRTIDFIQYFKRVININPAGTVIAKQNGMHPQEDHTVHPYNLEQATKRFQQDHIHNVLEVTNWDLEATARMLGIELNELKQKVDSYLSSGNGSDREYWQALG